MRDELNDDRHRVFQRLDETESSILTALNTTPKMVNTSNVVSDDDTTVSSLSGKVNATISDNITLQILKLLKDIQGDIKESKNN